MKKELLIIIKEKGHCDVLQCVDCPLKGEGFCFILQPERYTEALSMYVENYGKDEDLLEVLI